MIDIQKQPGYATRYMVSQEDMALINGLAKSALKPEEVYTFSLRLCDNEVDRDFERFDRAALEKLKGLFVGKSGIFDHQWSAAGQTARIYKTEVCRESGVTAAGDESWYLKGWAYMLRSGKNVELIDEIEAGIKKEVSIGCSVQSRRCSICGKSGCRHERGKRYDGKLCYFTLTDPTDAYEWSFVAVPAQRKAGVMKGFAPGQGQDLHKLLAGQEDGLVQLARLEREAQLGRSYMAGLRRELVRLAGLADEQLDLKVFAGAADKLEEAELLELTRAYEKRLEKKYPPAAQLAGRKTSESVSADDNAFLI